MKALLGTQKVDHKPARVDSRLVPDVWVEPKFVVNVLADKIIIGVCGALVVWLKQRTVHRRPLV